MKTIINIIILISLFFLGCAVKLPKITATGERTALENQIVGSYQMIEEQAFMVASLRGEFPSDSVNLTQEKRRVLLAFQRQRFNSDDIMEFKRYGTVGEAQDGFIEIISDQKYTGDSIYQVLVNEIVAEENEDRRLIMRRIIELHPEIDPNDKSKVGLVYSRLKQEASPEGTWIQEPDGSWKKK